MNPNDIIITGAGASAADGLPIQSDLFKKFWDQHSESLIKVRSNQDKDKLLAFDDVLNKIDFYFTNYFNIDVLSIKESQIQFPTFEECLGILDIALTYGEEFEVSSEEEIREIQTFLIFLIAKSILKEMPDYPHYHANLVNKLAEKNRLQSTAFLTTNYDLLLDNAIAQKISSNNIDYGVTFHNIEKPRIVENDPVTLLKLHGSLDWIYCSSSKSLIKESVERVIPNADMTPFFFCSNIPRPVIIPPSFIKSLSNFYIQQIWIEAEKCLRDAERLIFCGYSFPDADLNFKYLLKRAQLGSQSLKEIIVINNYEKKPKLSFKEESNRYLRFFGSKINLRYSDWSFEEFADNPCIID